MSIEDDKPEKEAASKEDEKDNSRLPRVLTDLKPTFEKAERKDVLIPNVKYDRIENAVIEHVKIGTDGVTWVESQAFGKLFNVKASSANTIFEHKIPRKDKISDGGKRYAHGSAVVGELDRVNQESPDGQTQALLQFARDTLINVGDSGQSQDVRRKRDAFTRREMPKLREARGVNVDELTGEPLKPGAAFHHMNPKHIFTNPRDVLNPDLGRNLNPDSHKEVHRENLNTEEEFEEYKAKRNSDKSS